jgi:16S rRNA (adenine(1408)-N(1))-methyltransferase
VTIDVGTGDGRAVLAAAARDPRTLAIGLDASASAMAEASRRAAGPAGKGGLENARFVLAAAEAPPAPFLRIADLVTVRFPWGSLLRGVVGADDTVAAGVASLVAADGALELMLAPSGRDGLAEVPVDPDRLADAVDRAFTPHGLRLVAAAAATAEEVRATHASWARRLGAAREPDRPVMLVRLRRCVDGRGAAGGAGDGSTRRP